MTVPISWWVSGGLAIALGLQTLHVYQVKGEVLELKNREQKVQLFGEQTTRAIENVWGFKSEKINEAAATRDRAREAAIVAATATADSMRERNAALLRTAKKACPVSSGPADDGSDPIGVLAKLSGVSDRLAEVYAKTADARGGRALHCEQSYDALERTTP